MMMARDDLGRDRATDNTRAGRLLDAEIRRRHTDALANITAVVQGARAHLDALVESTGGTATPEQDDDDRTNEHPTDDTPINARTGER
jgi:hypothetical protein